MGYRGDDLDLRTPQAGSAMLSDLAGDAEPGFSKSSPRTAARPGPIWVDDTVMSCANHAFEVAVAPVKLDLNTFCMQ